MNGEKDTQGLQFHIGKGTILKIKKGAEGREALGLAQQVLGCGFVHKQQ